MTIWDRGSSFIFCSHLVSDICAEDNDEDNNTDNDRCENNGTCVGTINSYRCECADGFVGRRCQIGKYY